MIDSSSNFRECWIEHRQMIRDYDMGDYIEAVESLVISDLPD